MLHYRLLLDVKDAGQFLCEPQKKPSPSGLLCGGLRWALSPFQWEVFGDDGVEPLYVPPDRFHSTEAAYHAGQARLEECIPIALVHEHTAGRIHLLGSAYQLTRAEAGMPSPVIRLSTLHPIFASVR
jgi:hypothetical protein